nr:MAG TPA: hypothetical protein [Caudoviricetes sp.]
MYLLVKLYKAYNTYRFSRFSGQSPRFFPIIIIALIG